MLGAAWTLFLLHAAVVKTLSIKPASGREALAKNALVFTVFFTVITILKVLGS
jgi:hypothetical protein